MGHSYKKAAEAHDVAMYLGVDYARAWDVVTCLRKKAYDGRSDADAAAERYSQEPYECPVCGRWHLTSGKGKR